MLVIKVYMWPMGKQALEHLISQATISLQGVARHDEGEIKKGERVYLVRLLKGVTYGGPKDGDDLCRPPSSKVWRKGMVFGHRPGGKGAAARGEWDLIGGALKALLGGRLAPYRGEG